MGNKLKSAAGEVCAAVLTIAIALAIIGRTNPVIGGVIAAVCAGLLLV